jgi:YidC/Oxa1 family membrane protein insertase
MDLVTLLPAVTRPAVNIPIWNQYTHFLVGILDGLASLVHSAGLGIILFTLIVKTLLLPLTVQSIRSSKAMQELQPKLKELQKKHGNDRQRISQETMALYQQHRVNPMAGCLPMVIQIPIFFGLYNAITTLSNSGAGLWTEPFMWLPSLAHPDPFHLLPIIAAFFQLVQTQMMKPANQPQSNDPQQAMMSSVMNIMPLTVVVFGWNFASGPVLYWAASAIYSVVQQWFITGWGSLTKWAPFLPELPEHRRLGYRPPRNLDEVVVVSGDGQPVYGPGPMGWFQRKMNEAQQQAMARSAAQASGDGKTDAVEAEVVPARATSSNGAAKGQATAGKGGKGKRNGKSPTGSQATARVSGNGATASAPSGAVIVPRKAGPAADGDRSG